MLIMNVSHTCFCYQLFYILDACTVSCYKINLYTVHVCGRVHVILGCYGDDDDFCVVVCVSVDVATSLFSF